MKIKQHGYIFFLLVSLLGSFFMTLTMLIALCFSLRFDEDHRRWLFDPFLLLNNFLGAAILGVIASPLLFFCLRRKRLSLALPVVFISVLTTAAVLTPFSIDCALDCAGGALIISVLGCMLLPNTGLEPNLTVPSAGIQELGVGDLEPPR